MKCRDCGKDGFANTNQVTKHKRTDCPKRPAEVTTPSIYVDLHLDDFKKTDYDTRNGVAQVSDEDLQEQVAALTAERDELMAKVTELTAQLDKQKKVTRKVEAVLPMDKCPSELKYIVGRGVLLMVKGRVTAEGVIADEIDRWR